MVLAACSGADAGGQPLDSSLEGTAFETASSINEQVSDSANADGSVEEGIKAHVMVSRANIVGAGAESAHAMAHFAIATRGDARTLVAAGLQTRVPPIGSCEGLADPAAGSFTDFDEVHLLDVGEVSIRATLDDALPASDDQAITLAPHAFPSISSFASGVMYTSRDREAASFPSGATYRVAVSGSQDLGGFHLEASAPRQLTNVTLSGEPLSRVAALSTSEPLDVTWRVGAPGDVVVVELVDADDASALVRCAFADDTGAGSVPAERLNGLVGRGEVALHRYRNLQAPLANDVAPNGEVRLLFDFETGVSVEYGP